MRTDAAALTRFQRMLLGTDGTVTHLLEAYADEPIEVLKLRQVFDTANDGDADLGLRGPDGVLRRQVVLRGRQTKRRMLYAEAVVVVERAHPALVDGLVRTDKPIGMLLAEHHIETFREILRVSREPAGPRDHHLGAGVEADVLSRTYRIVTGGRPVILITERFPETSFRRLPQ